ncbi:MAG: M20 family metallo-hydrolase [Euryarchaeota archaeon]|nr:M20 family metallo-hydrolase [Euryarchaeota archaeon]
MNQLEDLLSTVENYRDEMIEEMKTMLRIPAMGPENGGEGELERSKFIEGLVRRCGFQEVEVYNSPDDRVESKIRPSVIAKRKGRSDRTIWFVSHMDTVSPGDVKAWSHPPFDGTVVDGKLYGRGSEDNGQAIMSTLFALKAALTIEEEPEYTIAAAIVADEEAGSEHGVRFLIEKGLFNKNDIIYVPDFGVTDGSIIEMAEKSIIWLKFIIRGKQVHASAPMMGLNALRVGSQLLVSVSDHLYGKFSMADPMFVPPISTFEPTKRLANVENVNTVPGEDVFYMDVRLLPQYDPQECVDAAKRVAAIYEERTGATIDVIAERIDQAGNASPEDDAGAIALRKAIRCIRGIEPTMAGIGGQTCANWFRLSGIDAYVWETCDEMAHQVDEYVRIDNMVNDAKVYVALLTDLCYPGKFKGSCPEY